MSTLLLTRSAEKNRLLRAALPQALAARFKLMVDLTLFAPRAVPLDQSRKEAVLALDSYDQVIFISENAVLYGLRLLQDFWPQWPVSLTFFAVGPATANRLQQEDPSLLPRVPPLASSEGLLMLPDLQQPGKVLIVRGIGGRETLKETLVQRGAHVDYLEVYERVPLPPTYGDVATLDAPVLALLYSGDALERLCEIGGDAVRNFHVAVPSTRLQRKAYDLGIKSVVVAESQADVDMIRIIESWET